MIFTGGVLLQRWIEEQTMHQASKERQEAKGGAARRSDRVDWAYCLLENIILLSDPVGKT
jgi:hypothetical protein